MEDIVAVVDACRKLTEEINDSLPDVKNYLRKEVGRLLQDNRFVDAVRAHIESIEPTGNRSVRALTVLKEIAG